MRALKRAAVMVGDEGGRVMTATSIGNGIFMAETTSLWTIDFNIGFRVHETWTAFVCEAPHAS